MPAPSTERPPLDHPIVLDYLDPPPLVTSQGARPAPGRPLSGPDLDQLYAHPPERPDGRPGWLRVNFVSSLDGSAVGDDGRSGGINTPSDQQVFATLRSHADVVLVGAGTVRAERYRAIDLQPWQRDLRAELGLTPFPLLAVLSSRLELDPSIGPRSAAEGPVLVLTDSTDTAAVGRLRSGGVEVSSFPGGPLQVGDVVAELVGRGCPRILCEGGAGLHHRLLQADLVDELCLTTAARMVGGGGGRIVSGEQLRPNRQARLVQLLHCADGALFSRYLVGAAAGASGS